MYAIFTHTPEAVTIKNGCPIPCTILNAEYIAVNKRLFQLLTAVWLNLLQNLAPYENSSIYLLMVL